MVASMRRMSAGAGYKYLLKTVVASDGDRSLATPLTRYYAETGTPPGQWMGPGVKDLGLEVGGDVHWRARRIAVRGAEALRRNLTCGTPPPSCGAPWRCSNWRTGTPNGTTWKAGSEGWRHGSVSRVRREPAGRCTAASARSLGPVKYPCRAESAQDR